MTIGSMAAIGAAIILLSVFIGGSFVDEVSEEEDSGGRSFSGIGCRKSRLGGGEDVTVAEEEEVTPREKTDVVAAAV